MQITIMFIYFYIDILKQINMCKISADLWQNTVCFNKPLDFKSSYI